MLNIHVYQVVSFLKACLRLNLNLWLTDMAQTDASDPGKSVVY